MQKYMEICKNMNLTKICMLYKFSTRYSRFDEKSDHFRFCQKFLDLYKIKKINKIWRGHRKHFVSAPERPRPPPSPSRGRLNSIRTGLLPERSISSGRAWDPTDYFLLRHFRGKKYIKNFTGIRVRDLELEFFQKILYQGSGYPKTSKVELCFTCGGRCDPVSIGIWPILTNIRLLDLVIIIKYFSLRRRLRRVW